MASWPAVTSGHHRNRRCGPCILCNKMQPRYDHFCALTSSEQGFLQQNFGSEIAGGSCICRSHTVEAKRHRSDLEYIPAWKKSNRSCNIQAVHVCTQAVQLHALLLVKE